MQRRGFSYSIVKRALRDAWSEHTSDQAEAEGEWEAGV